MPCSRGDSCTPSRHSEPCRRRRPERRISPAPSRCERSLDSRGIGNCPELVSDVARGDVDGFVRRHVEGVRHCRGRHLARAGPEKRLGARGHCGARGDHVIDDEHTSAGDGIPCGDGEGARDVRDAPSTVVEVRLLGRVAKAHERIAPARHAESLRHRLGEDLRLVEAAPPKPPPMDRHRHDRVDGARPFAPGDRPREPVRQDKSERAIPVVLEREDPRARDGVLRSDDAGGDARGQGRAGGAGGDVGGNWGGAAGAPRAGQQPGPAGAFPADGLVPAERPATDGARRRPDGVRERCEDASCRAADQVLNAKLMVNRTVIAVSRMRFHATRGQLMRRNARRFTRSRVCRQKLFKSCRV